MERITKPTTVSLVCVSVIVIAGPSVLSVALSSPRSMSWAFVSNKFLSVFFGPISYYGGALLANTRGHHAHISVQET